MSLSGVRVSSFRAETLMGFVLRVASSPYPSERTSVLGGDVHCATRKTSLLGSSWHATATTCC